MICHGLGRVRSSAVVEWAPSAAECRRVGLDCRRVVLECRRCRRLRCGRLGPNRCTSTWEPNEQRPGPKKRTKKNNKTRRSRLSVNPLPAAICSAVSRFPGSTVRMERSAARIEDTARTRMQRPRCLEQTKKNRGEGSGDGEAEVD